MDKLLGFLAKYEIWGYILIGIVGFIYFQKLVQAWGEWRLAVFGLEREAAQRRLSTAITILALLLITGVSQFLLVSFVAPLYPSTEALPTPTIDLLATSTPTLNPLTPTAALLTTALPSTSTTGTPVAGCIPGQVEWVFPKAGEEISGTVELKGTINVPNMGFFKYEYSQPGSENWSTIAAGNQVKKNEALGGAWNTAQLVPGDYLLRLIVIDNQNQPKLPCIIPIKISAP